MRGEFDVGIPVKLKKINVYFWGEKLVFSHYY